MAHDASTKNAEETLAIDAARARRDIEATSGLDATDRAVIELIRSRVDVSERSDAEQAAFAARVFDRVEGVSQSGSQGQSQGHSRWRWPAAQAGAIGVAAAALLLGVWPGLPSDPNGPREADSATRSGVGFLSAAYYDESSETGLDSSYDEHDSLPDRYRAWSDALDVDGTAASELELGTS